MIRPLVAGALVLSLALAGPAVASSASTKTRVKRAVSAEIRDRYVSFSITDVSCAQLTSRRYKCSYVGLSHSADGPCRGTARATIYGRTVDVTSVSRFRCDF